MYSLATSDEVLSLLEERVFMSERNISFPRGRSAEECAGWSMENLIWTQRPDRSGANEVGFPDGHGDWDSGKMRVRADNIDRHTRYARIYASARARMKRISKRKYEVIRIGYRFCSYIHGQKINRIRVKGNNVATITRDFK